MVTSVVLMVVTGMDESILLVKVVVLVAVVDCVLEVVVEGIVLLEAMVVD